MYLIIIHELNRLHSTAIMQYLFLALPMQLDRFHICLNLTYTLTRIDNYGKNPFKQLFGFKSRSSKEHLFVTNKIGKMDILCSLATEQREQWTKK